MRQAAGLPALGMTTKWNPSGRVTEKQHSHPGDFDRVWMAQTEIWSVKSFDAKWKKDFTVSQKTAPAGFSKLFAKALLASLCQS